MLGRKVHPHSPSEQCIITQIRCLTLIIIKKKHGSHYNDECILRGNINLTRNPYCVLDGYAIVKYLGRRFNSCQLFSHLVKIWRSFAFGDAPSGFYILESICAFRPEFLSHSKVFRKITQSQLTHKYLYPASLHYINLHYITFPYTYCTFTVSSSMTSLCYQLSSSLPQRLQSQNGVEVKRRLIHQWINK